ncbi:hypothetical protein D3C80_1170900 [compost metagenome]
MVCQRSPDIICSMPQRSAVRLRLDTVVVMPLKQLMKWLLKHYRGVSVLIGPVFLKMKYPEVMKLFTSFLFV